MTIGYCNVHLHSRKAGHSVAAALAYRAGIKLRDSRTGEIHDYHRRESREDIAKHGIETSRPTALTAGAEPLQTLANAMESAERRCDSRLCRDIVIALPCELDEAARIELTRSFAAKVSAKYKTIIAWSVHRPGERGDDRNHHAHLVMPTRELDKNGELGAKLAKLDNPRHSGDEIAGIRNLWCDTANNALAAAKLDNRMSIGRRLDRDAIATIPGSALALEQRAAVDARTESYIETVNLNPGSQQPTEQQQARARTLAKTDLANVAARDLVIHDSFQGVTEAGTAAASQVTGAVVAAVREGTTDTPIYAPRARSRMSRWREAQERAKKAKGAERPGSRPDHEAEAQPTVPKGAATPQRPARQRRRRIRTAPEPAVVAQLGDLHPAPQESEAIIFGSLALVRPDPEAPATAPEPEAAPPPPPRKRRRRARPATHAALVPAAQPRPGPEPRAPNIGARIRREPTRLLTELTPAVVAQLGDLHPAPQESEAIIFGSLALVRPDPEAPATAPEPEAAPPPPPRKRRRRARPATHAALVPAAQPRPGPESRVPNIGARIRREPTRLLTELTPAVVAQLGDFVIHRVAGARTPPIPDLRKLRFDQGAEEVALAAVRPHVRPFCVRRGSPPATVARGSEQWAEHARHHHPSILSDIVRDLLELFGMGAAKPTLAPPRTVPTAPRPVREADPNLQRLDQLEAAIRTRKQRRAALAALVDLAQDLCEDPPLSDLMSDWGAPRPPPRPEDMERTMDPRPGPARVQAFADGDGRPPTPPTLQDADEAADDKVKRAVIAYGDRLRLAIDEGAVMRGEDLIIEQAGLPVPIRDDPKDKDQLRREREWIKPMKDVLAQHVEPFHAPSPRDIDSAIARWRAHWRTHGPNIARRILDVVWSPEQREGRRLEIDAKLVRDAAAPAEDVRRRQQPPTVVPAPAPAPTRSTWPPDRGGGLGA